MLQREVQIAMRETGRELIYIISKKGILGVTIPGPWFLWNNYLLNDQLGKWMIEGNGVLHATFRDQFF